MTISREDLLETLRAGDPYLLVGQLETEDLECKRQPYDLDGDKGKLELAKDISAFANASGGILLIGFATRTSDIHGHDEIECIRRFDLGMVDPDRYRKVLADWTWPPLENVDIQLHPGCPTEEGVASIVVPPAAAEDLPILVRKSLLDERRVELVFGYCERKHDRVVHYNLERLHGLLRDGRRFDTELRSGFQSLHDVLEELRSSQSAPLPERDVEEQIRSACRAVQLEDQSAFILWAVPTVDLDLRGLARSRDDPLVDLLDRPPTIRGDRGFDLDAGGNSQLYGSLRRAVIEGYKLLEMHRDGLIIFVTDRETICHGRAAAQREFPLINQLALVEMTYLFCLLVKEVYAERASSSDCVSLGLGIQCLRQGQNKLRLEPGPLSSVPRASVKEAPDDSVRRTVEAEGGESAKLWAFRLLSEFYAWVGFEEDRVPYVSEQDGVPMLDPSKIQGQHG